MPFNYNSVNAKFTSFGERKGRKSFTVEVFLDQLETLPWRARRRRASDRPLTASNDCAARQSDGA